MSENEDWLGLGDPAEQQQRTPGLVLPDKVGGHELRLMDRIHMEAAADVFIGKVHTWTTKSGPDGREVRHYDRSRAVFTTEDEDGNETWATSKNPQTRKDRSEGERWRAIMRWPVGTEPTPDDAMAFMANGLARLRAKWWPELQKARVLDELAARGEGEPG